MYVCMRGGIDGGEGKRGKAGREERQRMEPREFWLNRPFTGAGWGELSGVRGVHVWGGRVIRRQGDLGVHKDNGYVGVCVGVCMCADVRRAGLDRVVFC